MDGVKGKLGFGCMRMRMTEEGTVDRDLFGKMVDEFMAAGFNYFDTAHGYLKEDSEKAIRDCLTSRYPRDSYVLTDKLSPWFITKREDIRPFFESQKECAGVDYFDYYLMHGLNRDSFREFKRIGAFEEVFGIMKEGGFRHFGISFHDDAEVLEQILTEYPQIEVVQIQFNYLDYRNRAVDSKRVYETARRFGRELIIMEPVKGGHLAKLPPEAVKVFEDLGSGMSPASYALRFAAGFEGVAVVLSGMSDLEMIRDNTSFMKDARPLDERELAAVDEVIKIFGEKNAVPCTGCRYCMDVCPQQIAIPDYFNILNMKKVFGDWSAGNYYRRCKDAGTSPDECLECGACEEVCPQKLPIRELLKTVTAEFEKQG